MKITNFGFDTPKNRSSALNLVASLLEQRANRSGRRENLMKNISQTETKLKRLEETLETYKNQLNTLTGVEEDFDKFLEDLTSKFNLTQSEILETKSELLRKRIAGLQRDKEALRIQEERHI